MNRKKRKNLIITAVALAICLVFAVFFIPQGNNITASADENDVFKFTSIDTVIDVRENKTLAVTETLTAVWSQRKTSLIRDIQRISKTTRIIDGKKYSGENYFAKISDISATLNGSECTAVLIGKGDDLYLSDFFSVEMYASDGAKLETGVPYTFVLNYVYDMSDDKYSGFDDFTFDILGYEMNDTDSFHAKVSFPEGTRLEDAGVTVRENLSSDWNPDGVLEEYVKVSENSVEVNAHNRTKGLTLQVILPEGTFTVKNETVWYYWILLFLSLGAVVAVVVLTIKNFPQRPVQTVEFYPPEELSVMEFSAITHKKARSKDVAALVLKWADLGLITVEKDGPADLILRVNAEAEADKILACKEKVYSDGKTYFSNAEEKNYFCTLFPKGAESEFSTFQFKVAGYAAHKKLYEVSKALEKQGNDLKVMQPTNARKLIPFLGLLPAAFIMIYHCILLEEFVPVFFLIFLAAGTFAGTTGITDEGKLLTPLILIFPVMFFAMPYFAFLSIFAMPRYDYARILYIAPAIYAVCMLVIPFIIGRRTEKANKLYGRILGFKNFLLKAELPRIELMFEENPDYFSDILPWCYILGISKKVRKRLAVLKAINVPRVIQDDINLTTFGACMVYCSRAGAPRSSGGGGGGGFGGSSGGGGGGGGSRSR